jgi:hypothetical protein
MLCAGALLFSNLQYNIPTKCIVLPFMMRHPCTQPIFSLFQLKHHTWGTVHFINNLCIFYVFVPCILIELCTENQKKCTLFKINIYMFRTSCVHRQVDHLYMQFCMVCFSCVYVSSLAGGRMCFVFFNLLDCFHKHMKNVPYKTACTNGLPDDEHMMFETRKY